MTENIGNRILLYIVQEKELKTYHDEIEPLRTYLTLRNCGTPDSIHSSSNHDV